MLCPSECSIVVSDQNHFPNFVIFHFSETTSQISHRVRTVTLKRECTRNRLLRTSGSQFPIRSFQIYANIPVGEISSERRQCIEIHMHDILPRIKRSETPSPFAKVRDPKVFRRFQLRFLFERIALRIEFDIVRSNVDCTDRRHRM